MLTFTADKNRKLTKLALYNLPDLSYSALMKLIRDKDVKVNGKRINADVMLNVGDVVQIYYIPKGTAKYLEVYSDDNILVVDKKSGWTAEEVFADLSQSQGEVYFIHRLDRNTAGLMVFARNQNAESELLAGFKKRTFIKTYRAQVYGVPKAKSALLTAYLKKNADTSTVRVYDYQVDGSVQIKTEYKVLSSTDDTSELEVNLLTGKTHQIRAHLAHIGHFIIGDGKYGNNAINKQKKAKTQRLLAYSLTLHFEDKSPLAYLDSKTFFSSLKY